MRFRNRLVAFYVLTIYQTLIVMDAAIRRIYIASTTMTIAQIIYTNGQVFPLTWGYSEAHKNNLTQKVAYTVLSVFCFTRFVLVDDQFELKSVTKTCCRISAICKFIVKERRGKAFSPIRLIKLNCSN